MADFLSGSARSSKRILGGCSVASFINFYELPGRGIFLHRTPKICILHISLMSLGRFGGEMDERRCLRRSGVIDQKT